MKIARFKFEIAYMPSIIDRRLQCRETGGICHNQPANHLRPETKLTVLYPSSLWRLQGSCNLSYTTSPQRFIWNLIRHILIAVLRDADWLAYFLTPSWIRLTWIFLYCCFHPHFIAIFIHNSVYMYWANLL